MCPDKELLSAYFDGEIPSPWKETIAAHVASCPECSRALDTFAAGASLLRAAPEPDFESRKDAVFNRVAAHVTSERRFAFPSRIMIPLPAAVAAVAAIAFLLGMFITRQAPGTEIAARSTQTIPGIAVPAGAAYEGTPVSTDTRRLLDVLEGKEIEINITVKLPETSNLKMSGEPEILTVSGTGASR